MKFFSYNKIFFIQKEMELINKKEGLFMKVDNKALKYTQYYENNNKICLPKEDLRFFYKRHERNMVWQRLVNAYSKDSNYFNLLINNQHGINLHKLDKY